MARNTLAHANVLRDWRIYADFAQNLIGMARRLYVQEPFGVRLQQTVYALDITTFDRCLPVRVGRDRQKAPQSFCRPL